MGEVGVDHLEGLDLVEAAPLDVHCALAVIDGAAGALAAVAAAVAAPATRPEKRGEDDHGRVFGRLLVAAVSPERGLADADRPRHAAVGGIERASGRGRGRGASPARRAVQDVVVTA